MKTALAIIQNDLRQRRFIFGAAIFFSLLPFFCLAVPALRRNSHGFVSIFTNVLAFGFPVAVALGLGATMIGTDLTARRLSFYFSRPISSRALWYGKLISALITIYVSLALVVLPGAMYTFNDRSEWMDRNAAVAVFVIAPLVLLLLAHTLSMMVRSRSAWIAMDAAGVAVTAAGVATIVRPLLDALAFSTYAGVVYSMIAALVVVLVLTGGWHLARGRTDRLRNHVELSKFLWSAVAVILVGAGGFVFWLTRATATGLTRSSIYAAPAGDWGIVNGQMPHRFDYRAAFLVNIRDGRSLRLPVRDGDFGAFTFSRNGKMVAWTHTSDWRDRRGEVWTRRLDPLGPVNRTHITASQWAQMVISDDGSRLATFGSDLLNVADAGTGRSLASVRIPVPDRPADVSLYFVTPDVVRLYVASGARPPVAQDLVAPIYEFDVRTRSLQQTGAFQGSGRWMSWVVMPDGKTAVRALFNNGLESVSTCVADARTGVCTSDLPMSGVPVGLKPLSDGSLVRVVNRPDGSWLVRSTGAPPVRLAKSLWSYVATTAGMKAVLVAVQQDETERGTGSGVTTAIVDASTGRIERVIANLKPARRHLDYEDDPRMAPAGASNLIAATDRDGHLVRLDVNTGAVTPLPRQE